jgi:hypothetical protein
MVCRSPLFDIGETTDPPRHLPPSVGGSAAQRERREAVVLDDRSHATQEHAGRL